MSLAVLADHMASKGRGGDSMLIHMSPREVQGLQALAMAHGGSLTINPHTGLPEALSLGKLLPAILGFAVTAATGLPAWQVGLGIGAVETARTGDLGKGISAGLGAYGGAGLGAGMSAAGADVLSGDATALAAQQAGNLAGEQATQMGLSDVARQQMIDEASNATARVASDASPFEKISAGFDAAKANPSSLLTKDNFKYMAAAAAPVLADQAVKSNLPVTTTKPGMIRPYTYDPYGSGYIAGIPYEASAKRAASGGIMGFDESANSPMSRQNMESMGRADGMFNYAHDSGGVMRMAEGGIAGYAGNEGSLVGGYKPSDTDIFNYFKTPGLTDTQIAADMQKFGVSAADIARATGTQGQQADYERRFAQAVATPTTSAPEFLAATQGVGLQNQNLASALQNSGLSASAQYALTHNLNDAAGAVDASGKPIDFYNKIGYTAGALPGDQGGLEGLYANINYSAQGLQNKINSGALTVDEAQRLADAEMRRIGVSMGDVKAATGKDLFSLFTPKKVVTTDTSIVHSCPSGYHWDPIANACVPNISATQETTTGVTTPTNIATADRTALPVGVSGAGITTINPNGTITTRPNIPGIPEGGFTGMQSLRDAYTKGGGSLGYVPYAPKTIDEFNAKYNKLTGGSKQAYDYLTGKTPYSPTPYTPTGEVMKPYAESVLGIPSNPSKRMYLFDPATKQYKLNPDYAIPTYDKDGNRVYNVTNRDVSTYLASKPSNTDFYNWAKTNNLSVEQIAAATGMPITEIQKMFSGGAPADTTATTGGGSGGSTEDTSYRVAADGGLMAEGGLAALTMARGGMAHQPFFSKSTGKFNMHAPQVYADGGMADHYNLGGYSDGGRLLRGPGDGVSDSIPATIGDKRPARLADGEFVVPARIVSELGNGSTEAGARKLYGMMDRIQAARRGTVGKGKVAKNSRADKYLPV